MASSSDIRQKLREKIENSDELWNSKSKISGNNYTGLTCHVCGYRESWTNYDDPFSVNCNRKNKCGARVKTLELFPEVLGNIEKDFAPTRRDPHRPATEYLHSRRLYKSLKGIKYRYQKNIRKTPSGGVLFLVGKGPNDREVWNGRIFNPPPGENKGHNSGSTGGMLWRHSDFAYDPAKPTYVTEGVLDALSLIEMGFQAIAVLSSGQDPGKLDLGDIAGNLVIAFDFDSAGAGGLTKWKKLFPNARAIAPISGDWNDLLCRFHSSADAAKYFEESLPKFEAQARLLLAETAQEYAEIHHEISGKSAGLFEFGNAYHYSTVKESQKYTEIKTRCVSDFILDVEYYQVDTSNKDEPSFRCCVNLRRNNGHRPRKFMLSASDLATPGGLRKTLLDRALAQWDGADYETKALSKKITQTKASVVRQLFRTGHDAEADAYVFQTFAIDRAGRLHHPNPKGFFKIGSREFVAPARQLALKPKKGPPIKRIYELLHQAWPETGPLVFTFTLASWFANRIKPELGFFPFCSIWGDTQTGKSRLVRIANAMQCLDDEGLPLTKVNTAKGEMRKLAQRSSLMQALIEANREENVRFDFDVLLPMYNHGNPIRVTAVKTNDLQTQETPFLATILFAQNREQFKTKAQLERVISSRKLLSKDITPNTRAAFDELSRIRPQDFAWTFVEIMGRRQAIESSWFKEYEKARDEIIREVPDNRIAENHAVLLAFHRIITRMIGVQHDLFPHLVEIAAIKLDKCSHREASPADYFFEVLNGLSNEDDGYMKYAEEKDEFLHLRMAGTLKAMDKKGVRYVVSNLYSDLKAHPAFIKSNVQYRGLFGATTTISTRVWTFDLRKI